MSRFDRRRPSWKRYHPMTQFTRYSNRYAEIHMVPGSPEFPVLQNNRLFEALRDSETRFRSVMQTATDAVIIIDQTGIIVFWNRVAETVFGYSEQEAVGRPVTILVPDRYQRDHQEGIRKALFDSERQAPGRVWEVAALRKDRTEFPAEVCVSNWVSGEQIFFVGFVRDISIRKHVQEALRESERRFREMLEQVRMLAVILDSNGEIVFVNDFLLETTGWAREEVLGRNWFQLFLPEDSRAPVRAVFDSKDQLERFPAHFENEIVTRAGGRRMICWNNTLLRAPSGQVIGSASIGEDVTERRQREADLNRSHQDLERRVQERTQELLGANQALHRSQADLRALAKHLVCVREEENKRMSREIHDQLGQELTGAKFLLNRLAETVSEEQQEQREDFKALGCLLTNVLEEVRRIARDLRPAALDHFGLLTAIEWLGQDFQKRTGILFTTRFDSGDLALDDDCATSVFRIVQEALTNVARHSGATMVEVSFKAAEATNRFLMEIVDNGVGIDQFHRETPSLGLLGMRERAFTFGGDIEFSRDGERGTRVRLTIPRTVTESAGYRTGH